MLDSTVTTLTEKSFDTGELTINYAESQANGDPIVLLHGGTRWWQDWQTIMPDLAPAWHIYAADLRGHGKSGRDGDHYRLNDYVRDIAAFLNQRVGDPAVLVGHSLGSSTAIGTAVAAPEQVRAVVLVDPPLFTRDHGLELFPDAFGWVKMVYELTSSSQSYEDLLEKCRPFAEDQGEEMLQMFVQNLYSIAPEAARLILTNQLLEGFDLGKALSQIACPTLIISGDWDHGGAMRDEDLDFAKAQLPDATIIKIPNASHQLVAENPSELVEHMEAFFRANHLSR